jgi:hypothetical protein
LSSYAVKQKLKAWRRLSAKRRAGETPVVNAGAAILGFPIFLSVLTLGGSRARRTILNVPASQALYAA